MHPVSIEVRCKDIPNEDFLKAAVEIYLRSHHESLLANTKIELFESFSEFEISEEFLRSLMSEPIGLSKAELLVSIYVTAISVGEIHINDNIEQAINYKKVLDQLQRSDYTTLDQEFRDSIDIGDAKMDIVLYQCLDNKEKILIEEFDNISLNSNKFDLFELQYVLNSVDKEVLDSINITSIPNSTLDPLWNSLQFENSLKSQVLRHSKLSLALSRNGFETLTHNKLFILHGPPGSGKTTLCRSLSHKISIYQKGLFVEISCSKIFSRWFGESSNRLERLFNELMELIRENPSLVICILIDEIETIASSRTYLQNQNETVDSVRVVNTLLIQLDKLKQFSNFIIFCTSNFLTNLDPAFVDRADEIFLIDRPNSKAICRILFQSINELIATKIIKNLDTITMDANLKNTELGNVLTKMSEKCFELKISGRLLSKLPLIALTKYSELLSARDAADGLQMELPTLLMMIAKVITSREAELINQH